MALFNTHDPYNSSHYNFAVAATLEGSKTVIFSTHYEQNYLNAHGLMNELGLVTSMWLRTPYGWLKYSRGVGEQ
jgi:hypothetical protein